MLKSVSIGLGILVLAVFAYIGYSGFATGRSAAAADSYADGVSGGRVRASVKAEPSGSSAATGLPAMPATGGGDAGSNPQVAQVGAGANGVAATATDTVAPNPPNGMTFGGSGHFQLYRQGDLTWRLNTDTGETCVIFATDEEWRKPKVYRSGCRGKQ